MTGIKIRNISQLDVSIPVIIYGTGRKGALAFNELIHMGRLSENLP